MWNQYPGESGFGSDGEPSIPRRSERGLKEREWQTPAARSNSPDDVLGEVGLVLVIILGIVLAINAALVALHIA
jgi:hypothetical protein